MKIDCSVTEQIREDFNALWRCTQRGNTLEISMPCKMPDSSLFTLFLTERGERFIATEGGRLWALIRENCELPEQEAMDELRLLAKEFGMKEGKDDGTPIFFKDCHDRKLISSIAFDVATFAAMAGNVMLSIPPDEEESEKDRKFNSKANDYIAEILSPGQELMPNSSVIIPGVKLSAVVRNESGSKLWIVSNISGSGVTSFRKNVTDVSSTFKEVWKTAHAWSIQRTIPFVNDESPSYQPAKFPSRIADLEENAKQRLVGWRAKEELRGMLQSAAR